MILRQTGFHNAPIEGFGSITDCRPGPWAKGFFQCLAPWGYARAAIFSLGGPRHFLRRRSSYPSRLFCLFPTVFPILRCH
ncbi:hypothetical protein C4K38_4640 [Pseudomonas chlororaphis subsp. piscium]|nr:hypothetical protein C4K38_4640 [Pseudomonas chlororaphis subsp. piscium]